MAATTLAVSQLLKLCPLVLSHSLLLLSGERTRRVVPAAIAAATRLSISIVIITNIFIGIVDLRNPHSQLACPPPKERRFLVQDAGCRITIGGMRGIYLCMTAAGSRPWSAGLGDIAEERVLEMSEELSCPNISLEA